jgi:hypothetical protein
MERLPNCTRCNKSMENCKPEQVHECLRKSECEHCNGLTYHYPYGEDESRHCRNCGAEWPVWK